MALFQQILLLAYLTAHVNSQQDPLTNFCRRWSHQTTVIDNKLFIDGGYVNYGDQISPSTDNLTNPYLLYADLSRNSNDNFPPKYKNLTKGPDVPSLAGGALWADDLNKYFYLFGGQNGQSPQDSQLYNLWSYDMLNNARNSTPTTETIADLGPPAYGASAVDPNKGVGYYYGGWKGSTSELPYSENATAQQNLIIYSYDDESWSSVPFDNTPRAEGALLYIPASDAGMLVCFGGVERNSTGAYTGASMSTIHLWDIASGVHYTQQTYGTAPAMRRRFCGGVSWPEDQSSYNIYLYGGLPPYEQAGYGFNDVWTLSLPSFTWTNNFTSPDRPHHSASCNIVQKGQMIVMGGHFPNSSDVTCDAPIIQGQHNMNLRANNVAGALWYQYLPNITEYTVPPFLTNLIGGSATGPATVLAPSNGLSQDLAVYFTRKAPAATRSPSREIRAATGTSSPANTSKTNVGAIAGGVIGGIAVLVLLLGLVLCCTRRRKRARTAAPEQQPETSMSTVQSPTLYGSTHKTRHSAGSFPSPMQQSAPGSPPLGWNSEQPQQYYPPPQQGQPYFPPPPQPQVGDSVSPTYEMPNVRSPTNVADVYGPAPRRWRSPSAPITEE